MRGELCKLDVINPRSLYIHISSLPHILTQIKDAARHQIPLLYVHWKQTHYPLTSVRKCVKVKWFIECGSWVISYGHLPKWQFPTSIYQNDSFAPTFSPMTISQIHITIWQFPTDIFLNDNFPRTFLHMPFPGRWKFWDPTCCFNTKQNCKCNYITKSSFINVLSLLHKEQKYNTVHT